MPSASRNLPRLAAASVCGLLLIGAAGGCSTTQEKAARQQARAKHILEARAQRQKHKNSKSKSHPDGSQKR